MTKHTRKNRGFTLIETMVYLALFSIIIGGSMVTAYQIFDSSGRNQSHALLNEEGSYLMAKIHWALTGSKNIATPAAPSAGVQCTTSTGLSVDKWDVTESPTAFSLASGVISIAKQGGGFVPLNNANTALSNLLFTRCTAGSGNPESVVTQFTLTTRTPNGQPLSQDFNATEYIRK